MLNYHSLKTEALWGQGLTCLLPLRAPGMPFNTQPQKPPQSVPGFRYDKFWVHEHGGPCTTSNHMQKYVHKSVCTSLQEVPLFPSYPQKESWLQIAPCSLTERIRNLRTGTSPPSSLMCSRVKQRGAGERLQVWVLLTNKHRRSALWKQINHQDLQNPSPCNAPVLDSEHIISPHQVNISRRSDQALSVQE